MKRLFALFISFFLVMSYTLTSCGDSKEKPSKTSNVSIKASSGMKQTMEPTVTPTISDDPKVKVIRIASRNDERAGLIKKFEELHPDFPYRIEQVIYGGLMEYAPQLNGALEDGGEAAPDIYLTDVTEVMKYTQGEYSSYAATYKDLGFDVDELIKEADIAQYIADIGKREDGNVVALSASSDGGAFIYRRSIAIDVWGTDEPEVIKQKIGGTWENFFKAAEDLKKKGYSIVSGEGDVWNVVQNSANQGWVVDGKLVIDPKREAFLDISKKLQGNDYSNATQIWQEDWFNDMKDAGDKKVFGFFGPSWLVTDTLKINCGGETPGQGTYGDWAVCEPTTPFFWGGTWIFANKNTKVPNAVGELIKWMTLDTSETGLQSLMANGTLEEGNNKKIAVSSLSVMEKSEDSIDFLSGQNMFEVFTPVSRLVNGKNVTQYDEKMNQYWKNEVRAYADGTKTRKQAIQDFKNTVKESLEITE